MDVAELLNEVSPDHPEGDDLEYDPLFIEAGQAAQEKPEQSLGDSTIAGEPANWKLVQTTCLDLLGKSKDLRLAVLLTRAMINLRGWRGLEDGLTLVSQMMGQYWDSLHPKLDPEDDNDPTFRINTLRTLCDSAATLNALQSSVLFEVKGLGKFSLKDYRIATGELAPPANEDETPADSQLINAALSEIPIEELEALSSTLKKSISLVDEIDRFLQDKLGGSPPAPDMSALADNIKKAEKMVGNSLSERSPTSTEAGLTHGDVGEGEASIPASSISGEIRSRDDAAKMMDKISQYFLNNEPSSPVPLLMERAKRMLNLGFLEILEDMAPGGLDQAKNIGGVDSGK